MLNENQNTPAVSGVDFDNAPGEPIVGLNILQLEVNQADGPFTVEAITPKDFGEGARKKTLNQVIAKKGNTPYTMPIAASFMARAKDANLQPGDVFYIKRTADYISAEGTEGCQSFILKVQKAQKAAGKK